MRFVFDVRAANEPSRRWAKTAKHISIGRHPECDLVLSSELVSAQHAAIDESQATAVLRDLNSSNGTYLNGKRVTAPSPLSPGDVVGFGVGGSTLLTVALEPEAAVPSTLRLERGAILAQDRILRVGRAPDNDVVLDDASVSAHHARVRLDRFGRGVVEDLGSTNGISVGNPTNKSPRAEFASGDVVYFGSTAVPADKLLTYQPGAAGTAAGDDPDRPTWLLTTGIPLGACLLVAVIAVGGMLAWKQGKASSATPSEEPPAVSKREVPLPHDLAVVAAEKPVPPKVDPAQDFESIAQHSQQALVWLGVRHKAFLFPLAAAWAVKPAIVVTTAEVVTELKKAADKQDMSVVAWANGKEIPVKSFQCHPKYSESDPTGDARVRYNLGKLLLSAPVPAALEVATQETVRSLGSTTPLLVTGFFSTLKEFDPYDRLKLRPDHSAPTLRSTENDRPGLPPVFVVDVPAPKGESGGRWLDGAPVLGRDGAVVGILSVGSAHSRMIPISPFVWSQDF